MSKSFEIQGELHSIGDTQTFGANGFTKREFVIKVTGDDENPAYPNYVALEVIKDKCELMDQYQVGDEVYVHFNLSGRLWAAAGKPEKCFTSLQAWRVQRAADAIPAHVGQALQSAPAQGAALQAPAMPTGNAFDSHDFDDDVPF